MKIQTEPKILLTIGATTFKVNAFYYYKKPLLPDHVYKLIKIVSREDQWMLKFDEDQIYNACIDDFEEVPANNLKKCNCSFLCTGWIYR